MGAMSKVLGEKTFHALMKATVYGQFVAGEDKDKIKVRNNTCNLNEKLVFRILVSLLLCIKLGRLPLKNPVNAKKVNVASQQEIISQNLLKNHI